MVDHLLELVEEADRNQDGKIDFDEWQIMGLCILFPPIYPYSNDLCT